jgi:hypothetical protein
MRAPSNRVRWRRLAAAAAAGVVAATVLMATPASANTNFNRVCEVTEACIYDGVNATSWLWDFEGTDTNLSNNWHPGGGPRVDSNNMSLWGRGGSCWAVWGPNTGTSQPWVYFAPPGAASWFNMLPEDYDTLSSQFWWC